MPAAGVELKNITKEFTDPTGHPLLAVDDVSFVVEGGEFVTLLGPSGCGKTTLLRIIGGFEVQTRGQVFIGGAPMGLLPPNRRNTSMVFQSYAL
ncbi:MAG: ATP-binding cassette domain-containing protein, partial [bacterium]